MVAAEIAAVFPARARALVLVSPLGLWRDDAPSADVLILPGRRAGDGPLARSGVGRGTGVGNPARGRKPRTSTRRSSRSPAGRPWGSSCGPSPTAASPSGCTASPRRRSRVGRRGPRESGGLRRGVAAAHQGRGAPAPSGWPHADPRVARGGRRRRATVRSDERPRRLAAPSSPAAGSGIGRAIALGSRRARGAPSAWSMSCPRA